MVYSLARPALRGTLGENEPSGEERRVLDNVIKRVRLWKEVQPYYDDHAYKPVQSRGTESVVNALILAAHDAQAGQLSDDTRAAFGNMWALQRTAGDDKGSWPWLQFNLEPWEAKDSEYYGAALAAVAVGTAPEDYRTSVEIQPQVEMLRQYLRRSFATQSLMNRATVLWASTKLPGLLTSEQQKVLIDEISSRQKPDGGWELPAAAFSPHGSSFSTMWRAWIRADGSLQDNNSDGLATSFMVFVLRQAGVDRSHDSVKRGISWLMTNQDKDGFWRSNSVNKRRNPTSDTGQFMSDAATAYAVLALTESQKAPVASPAHH